MSPAAVSLHIKTLEEDFGERLFDRSVRPPVLTETGRQTLARARRVLDAWDRLGDHNPTEVNGLLELGAVATSIPGLLAEALAGLRQRRPQLRVRLSTAYSEELEERVIRGTLDAALMMRPQALPLGLVFVPIVAEPFHVVAPKDAAAMTDAALLTSLPYIRFRRQAWITGLIEAELAARRIRVEPAMEIDSLGGVLALVEAGLGVSVLPCSQLRTAAPEEIKRLPFGDPPLRRELGLLHRPDHPRAPQLDELIAALRAIVPADNAGSASEQRQPDRMNEGQNERQAEQERQIHAQHEPL
ncbi:MAG: LysR family transcriptional regulator [Geminicoccaceae bacterium]|nr:MAG: LysR family transcriptional regulator [Geminicoccaceae bacterium]